MTHMKKFFTILGLSLLALMPLQAAQRELVVKLKDGSLKAYHLTSNLQETVTMKTTAESITLNGDTYAIADIVELRIYEEVPEGAEVIDALQDVKDETATGRVIPLSGYDLSGRRVATASMKSGIYIINHQKVLIP